MLRALKENREKKKQGLLHENASFVPHHHINIYPFSFQ
jgi:hypothetical protein